MSIFDHPDEVPAAAGWRCPHCGTLQPETTRCWACARSPVACGSCRLYTRSLVTDLGFCGLDPAHTPIDRDAVRTCWMPGAGVVASEPGLFGREELLPALPPPIVVEEDTGTAGDLVEAPHVAPRRQLSSGTDRRARLRKARWSGDVDLD